LAYQSSARRNLRVNPLPVVDQVGEVLLHSLALGAARRFGLERYQTEDACDGPVVVGSDRLVEAAARVAPADGRNRRRGGAWRFSPRDDASVVDAEHVERDL